MCFSVDSAWLQTIVAEMHYHSIGSSGRGQSHGTMCASWS